MPSSDSLSLLIQDLEKTGFSGDIESSYAERIVASTDNSIYQLTPQAIFYPAVVEDINRVMRIVCKHRQAGYSLGARGGGTGTNGQSLSNSLILDCSRYLNKIINFDSTKQTVTVQPGVVLDQLNHFLEQHGLMFPIDISSSSRATIGGMVATDASGKGSIIYGKTSAYIDSLELVLADGSNLEINKVSLQQLDKQKNTLCKTLYPLIHQQHSEIEHIFPDMNRGLTGYNLQHCINEAGYFKPCFLISGSEGTLALTRQITLRVIAKPTHRMLTVIFYDHFLSGLQHIQPLLESHPAAIEMLDDKILKLARSDSIWFEVKSVLQGLPQDKDIKAVNYVEHVADSEQELTEYHRQIQQILSATSANYHVIHQTVERQETKISSLWNLRKKAVGLLGQSQDGKRGIAFVEDTAVPPQNLASYVSEFKQILDKYNLQYGMYGHADAGVLHVRPVLDLLQQQDRHLIREISDQVALLARRHGGIIWGEHGRGFRGEYTPLFFGEKLYPLLCEIKKLFDPENLLNPGKLTTPEKQQKLIRLDEVSMRGELDSQIPLKDQTTYASSLSCNGNGACYNWRPEEAMCPSFKATRNKLYSPKGRSALLREWLRLKNKPSFSPQLLELEQTLFHSLQLCLSCKSCTASCPVKVDIPELKSKFLQSWYKNRTRPFSSLFQRYFESIIALGRISPRLSNALIERQWGKLIVQKMSGLNHLPAFSTHPLKNAIKLNKRNIKSIHQDKKAVILLRDNYMQSFDRQTLQAGCDILHKLGYRVYLSDILHNAKILHVKGYRDAFSKLAGKVLAKVDQLNQTGLPLISTESVTRLMFEMEYADIYKQKNKYRIVSIESFICQVMQQSEHQPKIHSNQSITLLPHCMEQTIAKESSQNWQTLFQHFGLSLKVINAGCCGMSGLFGHEKENNQLSERIFNLVWKPTLETTDGIILASGFSCRCQTQKHQIQTVHPAVYLADQLDRISRQGVTR